MKKILRNIFIAAAALTTGWMMHSCTSVADELTTLDLTRFLEPLNLTHSISNGDSVLFSWDLVTERFSPVSLTSSSPPTPCLTE